MLTQTSSSRRGKVKTGESKNLFANCQKCVRLRNYSFAFSDYLGPCVYQNLQPIDLFRIISRQLQSVASSHSKLLILYSDVGTKVRTLYIYIYILYIYSYMLVLLT